jgi:hypothetical protein
MTIKEFRKKIKPNVEINIESKKFVIKEIIKFRLDDGSFYIKCFLNNNFIVADDEERNIFIFGEELKTPFKDPFPKTLQFQGKDFKFLYEAHAIAEKIWGEAIYKKGYAERFWDYDAKDGSYLSLGFSDISKVRLDLCGKVVNLNDVSVK